MCKVLYKHKHLFGVSSTFLCIYLEKLTQQWLDSADGWANNYAWSWERQRCFFPYWKSLTFLNIAGAKSPYLITVEYSWVRALMRAAGAVKHKLPWVSWFDATHKETKVKLTDWDQIILREGSNQICNLNPAQRLASTSVCTWPQLLIGCDPFRSGLSYSLHSLCWCSPGFSHINQSGLGGKVITSSVSTYTACPVSTLITGSAVRSLKGRQACRKGNGCYFSCYENSKLHLIFCLYWLNIHIISDKGNVWFNNWTFGRNTLKLVFQQEIQAYISLSMRNLGQLCIIISINQLCL